MKNNKGFAPLVLIITIGFLVVGSGSYFLGKNSKINDKIEVENIILNNQTDKEELPSLISENLVESNTLLSKEKITNTPLSDCDIIRSFAKNIPSNGSYSNSKAFCGIELKKPFETNIGTFIVESKTIKAQAPYPGAKTEIVQKDTLYYVTKSGNIEIPLNYQEATGGIDVPIISSVIDLNNNLLMVQLKNKSVVSFVGIDYVAGSNSVPISVSAYDIFLGKSK